MSHPNAFQSIHVVGGAVPPSLLGRIQAGEAKNPASLSPSSYHLPGSETPRDAAARAWAYLRGAWTHWRGIDEARIPGSPGTGPARERWLLVLLRELGYGQVQTLPSSLSVEGIEYPISHLWLHVPIHLLGPGVDLDRRNVGVAGAARAPQAMVQEFLNRSDNHLWAILSNGLKLRLLRDSTALAGSAYLEFDLEAMFDGELYSEFVLLWQMCHVSRLEKRATAPTSDDDSPPPEPGPADCWLESWRGESVEAGTRALDKLRGGVEDALVTLGTGFVRHPDNRWLVDALHSGEIDEHQLRKALLRTVYRLLFCFVAEDREALLNPAGTPAEQDRYRRYFSTARLRRLSRVRSGGPHPDLWQSHRLVLRGLGSDGIRQLAVPALGGLFDPDSRATAVTGQPHPDLLLGAELTNADFLTAIRKLAWVDVPGQRVQPVDYLHLGAEELGSVYESLLELTPQVNLDERTFTLTHLAGNERKTTGSYYTPPALVSVLLDTALDPLIDDAMDHAENPAEAELRLLSLTVCDPASGSGGFLVAAARRIARRVAQVRSGEDEPVPAAVRHALHDVIARCIYGVDINDLAAELAKVSLWLEALEPGKPLGFLDARIRVGNSLLGTTPALLANGVPDAAFKEIEGDDKKVAASVRKRNKAESSGQDSLPFGDTVPNTAPLTMRRQALLAQVDDVDEVRAQAHAWDDYEESPELTVRRRHADAWCAAFVWPLVEGAPEAPTDSIVRQLSEGTTGVPARTIAEIERLAHEYRFFHWHLEFPEVFGDLSANDPGPDGWPAGFSCVIGNPPWERVKLEEKSYFAALDPQISTAKTAAIRKRLISQLVDRDPQLFTRFKADLRRAAAETHFLGKSGRYKYGGVGDVNTYAVFADLMCGLIDPRGRLGAVVQSGIVSGFTYRRFVQRLLADQTLVSFLGFENEEKIFESVHNMTKFGLLTLSGRLAPVARSEFMANARQIEDLTDPTRRYTLSREEIAAINPNSQTVPAFRWGTDAGIAAAIHLAAPSLWRASDNSSPWGVEFLRMFDMTNDSKLFMLDSDVRDHISTIEGVAARLDDGRLVYPLYEGKMIWPFDHRYGTYEGQSVKQANKGVLPHVDEQHHDDPFYQARPRYWVESTQVESSGWWNTRSWSFAFRDVGPSERSFLPAVVPKTASGNQLPLLSTSVEGTMAAALCGVLSSMCVDYALRQSSTRMNLYVVQQAPVLSPDQIRAQVTWLREPSYLWISRRVLELSYTTYSVSPFARECGDDGAPFRWSDHRRALIQAELDAAVFHLYGLSRSQVSWILDSFRVLGKNESKDCGEYRTKRLILEVFDTMQHAIDSVEPYETSIDPEPSFGPRHPAQPSPQEASS